MTLFVNQGDKLFVETVHTSNLKGQHWPKRMNAWLPLPVLSAVVTSQDDID